MRDRRTTQFDPERHHRRSIRLKGYDYAQAGAYFVTVCTQGRVCLFGDVVNAQMELNDAGRMMESAWLDLPNRFPTVELDEFVMMPNHMHGIIVIVDRPAHVGAGRVPALDATTHGATTRVAPTTPNDVGAGLVPAFLVPALVPDRPKLGDIIGAYKSIATDEYIAGVHQYGWPRFDRRLLQRNYYEHMVRNERELNAIRQYIQNNPLKWALDLDNPVNWKRRALENAADIVYLYLREAGL